MPTASPTRRLAVLLTLALSGTLAARADEASHRAKATELMAILHTERLAQNVSDNLKKEVNDVADKLIGASPSDASKARAADLKKNAGQLIDAQLSWQTLQSSFTDIYEKNFTEEQLDGIIAFYKSPAGLAMLQNMPNVSAQVVQFGNTHVAALQPQLKQIFEDFQKSEAATPGAATPVAPAKTPAASKPAPTLAPAAPSKPK